MSTQHVCPNCGYCPHCGRSNARPWGHWPPYPWTYPWTYPNYYNPTWTVTSGFSTTGQKATTT